MRELIIKIDMNNAAFGENRADEAWEVEMILRSMITKIRTRAAVADDIFKDSNGNCVASIEVIETL